MLDEQTEVKFQWEDPNISVRKRKRATGNLQQDLKSAAHGEAKEMLSVKDSAVTD